MCYKTDDERRLADELIAKERSALDKWFAGDTSGYADLWSRRSFTYFDGLVAERVENHETIEQTLRTIEGKLFADAYEFRNPRVQGGSDMAVLTFQLFAKTSLLDMAYNCIEVFQREEDGVWRVIHSTWSPYQALVNKVEIK